MNLRALVLAVCMLVLVQPLWAASILIYGPSMDPASPNEQSVAEDLGHDVTVVTAIQWSGMSASDFGSYDAIVFGDRRCDGDWGVFSAADGNKDVWSPVVRGNVVIHTADPTYHYNNGEEGALLLMQNAINFAAAGGLTGVYASTGCYADGPADLDYLSGIGAFSIDDQSYDDVSIVEPGHPTMAGLTDAALSDWNSTGHALFSAYPPEFVEVARDNGSEQAVVIARGAIGAAADVPTVSLFGLAMLGLALGLAAVIALRR